MSLGETLVIRGRLDGCVVDATWRNGTLLGDATLLGAAQLVVDSGLTVDQDGRTYTASFSTLQGAAIALMRALDDIESVRISAPAEALSPFSSLGGDPLSNDPRR